ncbi:MAG: hypothetical protein JRC87_02520 [Deltaproteobacteria bacterium]|nr:hypothetical protein [Deltaproteobacteria bacterium]
MNIALLYEHPTWSGKLIETFQSNGIDLQLVNIADLSFCPDKDHPGFNFAVNRINMMPSSGRDPSVVFHTLHYLNWLETMEVTIVNGSRAHFTGSSKALQNGLFRKLGLHCPQAVAVYRIQDILTASETIGFPLIIKPNIGGSGSGISRYDTYEELETAVKSAELSLGVDGTGLVQQYIQSDGYVYRVEVLGNSLFYSIRQKMIAQTFNYCAADGCSISPSKDNDASYNHCALNQEDRIQTFKADDTIVAQVISIIKAAGADFGGVEYLMDIATGMPCFYDFNPYSNFVANGKSLLGFSPEQRFVDFIKDVCSGEKTLHSSISR